jgi:hypothetical protein
MSPSVNYYHYSVFKLLVVNLRTRFGFAVSPKKIRLRPAWRLPTLTGFDCRTWQAIRFCLAGHLPEKFSGSGDADSRSKAATSTLPAENRA